MKKPFFIFVFRNSKSSGFTLVELLAAMAITIVVVSIAGFSLANILSANGKAESETERRVNLNRALDFIADEIRMANSVSSFTISSAPSGNTGVLRLTVPSDSTNPNRVYYIGPSGSNWGAPYSVFRAAGTYSTSDSVSNANTLVDDITAPSSTPPCRTGLLGANGFYACIWNSSLVDLYLYGKLTDAYGYQTGTYEVNTTVFARGGSGGTGSTSSSSGSTSSSGGTSSSSGSTSSSSSSGSTSSSSGSTGSTSSSSGSTGSTSSSGGSTSSSGGSTSSSGGTSSSSGSSSSGSTSSSGGTSSGGNTTPSTAFTVNNGTVTFNQSSNLSIQVIGGAITCGAGGPTIPTTTTVNVTSPKGKTTSTTLTSSTWQSTESVGTTVTVTGTALANSCIGSNPSYNSATNNGTQVLSLRNGDSVPSLPAFSGQKSIAQYLSGYINTTTQKVTIAGNQVIYLYELGVPYSQKNGNAAYDLQDLVVLATIQ